MRDTVMEATEHVVESTEPNHITASLLAGRSSSDSPCSESVSRNSPITTWSDNHLFSEEESGKGETFTSASKIRISKRSSEQTADLAIVYGFIDLIPAHLSTPGLDQSHVPHHTTTEGKLPLEKHMGVMDYTESCMSTRRTAGDCALGESRNPNGMWPRGSKAFACPYFRLDPIRHIECLSRKVNRIQDVKQHLARRHYVAQTESRVTSDNIEGVSPSAQKSLKVRVDRRLPPEGQWYTIWDILFKRMGPKLGPYLGNTEEEIIGITREICQRRSNEAVSRFLIQKGLPASRIGFYGGLMMGLLESLGDCSNEEQSDSGLGKLPEISLDQTLKDHPIHTQAPCDGANPPKATDKGEDQEVIIPPPQVQSPSVKTDSLPSHGLPGLEVDWGSISERSDLTLYNESHSDEMLITDRVPIWGHLGEPDCTFKESPSNSTGHNSLASGVDTPESGRCSESPIIPSKKQRQAESYNPSFRSVWKCHECAWENNFTSGRVCQNYPCQHQYYLGCCEAKQLEDNTIPY